MEIPKIAMLIVCLILPTVLIIVTEISPNGNVIIERSGHHSTILLMEQSTDSNTRTQEHPWPMFKGNPQRTGLSPYNITDNNGKLKWRFQINNRYISWALLHSSPAIGNDGTIYVGSYDGNLYAVTNDGKLKWKYYTADSGESSPAIDTNGTIYIGSESERLYAINQDGSLKWSFKAESYVLSSPLLCEDLGLIVFGSVDQNLYALNFDGSLRWKYQTDGGLNTAPLIDKSGTIYASNGRGNIYAINSNGTLRWNTHIHSPESSISLGSDNLLYTGSNDEYLYNIDLNGTIIWQFKLVKYIQSSPAIDNTGTIYVGTPDNHLYAINPNGTLKWKYGLIGEVYSTSPAVSADGTIIIGDNKGYIYAIDGTGTLRWKNKTHAPIDELSSPAIGADGTVYIASCDGYLYAIGHGPDTPPETSSWPFPGFEAWMVVLGLIVVLPLIKYLRRKL